MPAKKKKPQKVENNIEAGKAPDTNLKQRSTETQLAVSKFLGIPGVDKDFAADAVTFKLDQFPPLKQFKCPGFNEDPRGCGRKGTLVQIDQRPVLDIAQDILRQWDSAHGGKAPAEGRLVLVLNDADPKNAGGQWKDGVMGQEEEIFYRTTITYQVDEEEYELGSLTAGEAQYAAKVGIIRANWKFHGHRMYDLNQPDLIDSVAVVSVAGLEEDHPKIQDENGEWAYIEEDSRETLKETWLLILRLAAHKRHRRLVLSVLGVRKANPCREVINAFKAVASSTEFIEGWFETIVFSTAFLNAEEAAIAREALQDWFF